MLHLAELRPDYVKLDGGLVRNASRDRVRGVLLRALAEAAHALEIQVVAEGVETAEDLAFCREIGADLVQGYYLARPASAPEVPAAALQRLAALG
jgi:EAL domain-containing protein (putative c-di-GMP-specific phosphodiesterase class I)